jgi:hypothetical protein
MNPKEKLAVDHLVTTCKRIIECFEHTGQPVIGSLMLALVDIEAPAPFEPLDPVLMLEKFPQIVRAKPNTNCLEDMICPECGSRGPFGIEMSAIIMLHDEGTDEHGDTEWDDNSACNCDDCQYKGQAGQFKAPGLDAMLEEKRQS